MKYYIHIYHGSSLLKPSIFGGFPVVEGPELAMETRSQLRWGSAAWSRAAGSQGLGSTTRPLCWGPANDEFNLDFVVFYMVLHVFTYIFMFFHGTCTVTFDQKAGYLCSFYVYSIEFQVSIPKMLSKHLKIWDDFDGERYGDNYIISGSSHHSGNETVMSIAESLNRTYAHESNENHCNSQGVRSKICMGNRRKVLGCGDEK